MNLRLALRSAALFASLVAIGAILHLTGFATVLDKGWIDTAVRDRGIAGEAVFVALGAFFIAVGLPRQMIAFLGGYAFGFLGGGALALAAAALGCVVAFGYARLLGRDLIAGKFPARVRRIDDFLAEHPFTMTLLIRFLPIGSNLLTNLAAGVSRTPAAPFLLGSALGYIPQTAVFALVGSGIAVDPAWHIAASALLFAASGALGVHLYRRCRRAKRLDEETDRALAPENGNGAVHAPSGDAPGAH